MDEITKKKQFVQLQFSALLLACSLLPDFGSVISSAIGLGGLSFVVIIARIIGLVGAGLALWKFYNDQKDQLPVPFLATIGGGLVLTLITLIPGTPVWLDYIALIAIFAALWLAKDSLGITWKTLSTQGAYLILLASLLHLYANIDGKISTSIAALVGLILYLVGLGKLKQSLDAEGANGASRLKIAAWLGIVAAIFGIIPLLGAIIGGIFNLVAFILEFLGYSSLTRSQPLNEEGRDGARKLRISMIIMLVAAIINFFPLTGIVVGILTLVALWFVFKGWTGILFGLERN